MLVFASRLIDSRESRSDMRLWESSLVCWVGGCIGLIEGILDRIWLHSRVVGDSVCLFHSYTVPGLNIPCGMAS
jgi:hypothetical protein